MDGVNFCEPHFLDRLWKMRFVLTCAILAALLGTMESIRLSTLLQNARSLDRQRDAMAAEVRLVEQRAKAVRQRQATLAAALHARDTSTELADGLAVIGNALSGDIALTVMRSLGDGVEIEGRSPSVDGVRKALRNLAEDPGRGRTLEIRRDENAVGWVSFRIGAISGVRTKP